MPLCDCQLGEVQDCMDAQRFWRKYLPSHVVRVALLPFRQPPKLLPDVQPEDLNTLYGHNQLHLPTLASAKRVKP